MDNLEIYNRVRECPKDAQREIKAGALKGKTDINPMWRIKMLTEVFGACGFGWKTRIVEHWTEQGEGEAVAWVRIELYVKQGGEWSEPIEGIGGYKQSGKGRGDGMSDEAYKGAYTDAISVACKALGMAANIYWQQDTTKYSQEQEKPARQRRTAQAEKQEQEKPKQYLSWNLYEAGRLAPLADWLAKIDPSDHDAYNGAINTLKTCYTWEDDKLLDAIVKDAFKTTING